jgi:molybdopterin/thiamine biosynthesis adenylyltransferase
MDNVVIVGLGALGSHVMLLARNWKARFTLIDFDRVEMKNTQAQFHTKMTIRQNKAQALSKSLQGLYGMKVKAVPHKLVTDNVEALLGDASLVLDCTDNIAARKLIQDFCKARDIACLHGAMSADASFARSVWTEHFVGDAEGVEGEATCEDGENLPLHALYAGVITATAQRFLLDGTKASFQMTPTGFVRLA